MWGYPAASDHSYSAAPVQVIGQATGVALDTKTGLLCHTYDDLVDTYIGTRPPASVIGHPSFDSAPLCVDLSQHEKETVAKTLRASSSLTISERPDDSRTVFSVKAPNGMVYPFSTLDQARQFMRTLEKP